MESQLRDEASLLNEIKRLIRIRQSHKALMNGGDIRFVCNGEKGNPLIYYRSSGEENILVVINPTDTPYDLKAAPNMQEMIYNIGGRPDHREGQYRIKERSAALWTVRKDTD